ncbi:MAG: HAD hydrolase-like protein [Holophaga sp.]|jgi:phosphoglycolate phosphatase-like HAD superfamily hydrolase
MPLCFDLDGTLGLFGGGYVLLRAALGDLWGDEPTPQDLAQCQGSTDWEIVNHLYGLRFGGPLPEPVYAAYDRACLARFTAAFHPLGNSHTVFKGIVAGMARLADAGHRVWLVSGNTPSVLDFKAGVLGVDPRIPRLGSLPHMDRAALIRKALEGCPGPHLYVGDRPHDRLAAERAGVPFLGVGNHVPGDHPILDPGAEAEHLVQAVEAVLGTTGGAAGIS